jgi:hypothetical protein
MPGGAPTTLGAMSHRRPSDGGSRLSPQTLVVASLASLTAAIVTSTFWRGGTPITAALTPVIVALASEVYSRPARRLTELGSRAATRSRSASENGALRERAGVRAPARRTVEAAPPREPGPGPGPGPVRVYRSQASGRRRVHLKAAIATAALAFAIAAAVLTLPELVFGGSLASHGKTTFFGGHSHRRVHKQDTHTSTTPQATTPTSTAPQTATTPSAPPAQTTPQTTTPSSTPPVGGTPPPQGTTTPAQTPPGQ